MINQSLMRLWLCKNKDKIKRKSLERNRKKIKNQNKKIKKVKEIRNYKIINK